MPRAILLGASNVTISLPSVLRMLHAAFREPVEVFAAIGHGRSYGMRSRVLFREMTGIVQCGLWQELDRLPQVSGPTVALVTDVGNDLLYGAPVENIVGWVETCLDRLVERNAEIVLTRLPLASVARLSPLRYNVALSIFFPGKGAPWPVMQENARVLDARLAELTDRFPLTVVEQPGEWYGIDPIHVRRRLRPEAWRAILESWPSLAGRVCASGTSWMSRLGEFRRRPLEERWFGRMRLTTQPVLRTDRLTVWKF